MTIRASMTIKHYDIATSRADWCLAFLEIEAEGDVCRSDRSIAVALPRVARLFFRQRGEKIRTVAEPSPSTFRRWLQRLERGEDLLPRRTTRPAN